MLLVQDAYPGLSAEWINAAFSDNSNPAVRTATDVSLSQRNSRQLVEDVYEDTYFSDKVAEHYRGRTKEELVKRSGEHWYDMESYSPLGKQTKKGSTRLLLTFEP